ncbi:thiamine pyrophosphate-dependent enzyme [Methanosarcina sp.]|uniref:thiamine pyrophosphate-dependent enzyme n=1 Tax=Methanosarcina sp. TaxID=2213 RepID=UPI0029897F92|nr:thiamine pyrophosphate-dependent enzyme [Methanosarcina sp.]MDW5549931.1 thiamine pyrophosphate-dependent enzyme [Methanosarcina sp.]MDW5552535.1 thiamine pyrophosphate-dependent enzyme [Methanosarcina sp.]MDW5560264.1 thiamine pyrophosphate-dependent enzyme [Methanosarcina sp.]
MKEKKEALEYTGFQALYLAALDSDVSFITGVPGYPVTSLMELFLRITGGRITGDYSARWFTNEKVALETALGSSVSGRRTLVLVKHVGMNLLSDPLITSVTHTIGAGLVIIAGDDPGAKGSQNEQDSRWYGRIAEIAVFDPTSPDTAYRSLRRAYELSEETKTPVLLRVTAGLEKTKGKVNRLQKSSAPHPEFDREIWKKRMVEKHRLFHFRTYPLLEEEAENTDLNEVRKRTAENTADGSVSGHGYLGIISSGFTSSIVEEILSKQNKFRAEVSYPEVSHLSLGLVNPLPLEKIKDFLKSNQKVLVAEESEPFIEEQIRIAGKVYGKKTGHLPYGQVRPEDLEFALEHIEEEILKLEDTTSLGAENKKRVGICDNCAYLPLYRFLSTLDVRIAGDMGCSVRSAPEPLVAVDVSFALGSAISVACGFEKKGIAVIGDFALAHSGILGLLSAANTGCNVLVLVLQNEVAAMTGGQAVPDLRKVVEAITSDVFVFDIDASEKEVVDETQKITDETEEQADITGEVTDKVEEVANKIEVEEVANKIEVEEVANKIEVEEVANKIEKLTDKAKNEIKVENGIEKLLLTPKLSELIQAKLALPGLSVIFIKGKCRKYCSGTFC